jgi:phosphoribosylpyrophosphate synthetase
MPPELSQPLCLEQQVPQEGARIATAYHPYFSGFYNHLYVSLLDNIRSRNFQTNNQDFQEKPYPIAHATEHSDGSSFYAALEKDGFQRPDAIVAPAWFAPPLEESLFHLVEMADAFTQSQLEGVDESTITDRFIAVLPYAELREDDNSPLYLRKDYTAYPESAREAVTARIFANSLASNGVTDAIFIDPHSEKGMRHFKDINTLCLTAAPLFVDHLIENNYIDESTELVALDIGAAQKCFHMAKIIYQRTGISVQVTILNKARSGHGEVDKQEIIYGDPKGKKVIIFDESVASGGSIVTTSKTLVKAGSKEIIPCITHPILCGKYSRNIQQGTRTGIMPVFLTTNTLPQSRRVDYMSIGLEVLPIDKMLAFFARQVAITSIEAVKSDPSFSDYILTPIPKTQLIEDLNLKVS